MTDTLAYEIGAVFFLAVLFMAGTLTRDLFPKGTLKTVKLSMFGMAALLVGFVVYRKLPDIFSALAFTPLGSAETPSRETPAPGVPTTQRDTPRPAIKTRKVRTIPQAAPTLDAAPELQDASPPAAGPPSAISPPQAGAPSPPSSVGETSASVQSWRATPVEESRNPVKRAIKSVGHFLHIGPEKYQSPVSVPQPAVAP